MDIWAKLKPYFQFGKFIDIIESSKQFLYLWIAQVLTQNAVSFVSGAFAYLSHKGVLSEGIKGSAAGIGVISILSTVPALFVGPIAGVLADWFSKKKIMIMSNVMRFFLLISFIIINGWQNQLLSYVLILLLTAILQFFIPAQGGLYPKIIKKKYLLLANSMFSLTVYASLAVGFLFAGPIVNTLGVSNMFIVCSILFIISTLFLYKIDVRKRADEGTVPQKVKSIGHLFSFLKKLVADALKGVSYSFKNRVLRFALIHLFILQVGGLTLFNVVYRIGSEIYNVSPETAGLVVFAPIAIGLLSGLVSLNIFGRNRRRIILIWFGTLINFIGFACMGIISQIDDYTFVSQWGIDTIISTGSLLTVGFSIPFLLIPAQTVMYENSDAKFRGRVLGVWLALTTSVASIVATAIGFLSDRFEKISVGILSLALLELCYSVVLFSLYKRKRLQKKKV